MKFKMFLSIDFFNVESKKYDFNSFEIELNGIKKKYNSLRKAFYDVWGSGPTMSQWDFWFVEGIPLEEFRKKILLDEN